MRAPIVLIAAAPFVAAISSGGMAAAADDVVAREVHLVAMDELSVPIVDGDRPDGTLRIRLVLEATDAAAADRASATLPPLRAASLAAALEFARLYASPSTPVDVARLASDMTAALRAREPGIARALVVEVAASRA